MGSSSLNQSTSGSSLGEILEKVLDKGVVIAGDISIALADVELLTIKIRLVIASIDKAEEMGIDWWKTDPNLSSKAKEEQEKKEALKREEELQTKQLQEQNKLLLEKLNKLEEKLQ
ncbi:MAG: gas vesicle protein GvpJ [Clostridiales bacterium GWF2_38_85]|nr:MAG: gas vesicle protein GvpJ [Clostridiales bacterium GWF2_38_85]